MSYNRKNLMEVAPPQGEVLSPSNYGKPGRMKNLSGITREARRIYRLVCEGKIPVEEATKLFYMLDRMSRMAETALLEERLKTIEGVINAD